MGVIAFGDQGQVPETKGKSLEQIQEAWAEHDETQSAPSSDAPRRSGLTKAGRGTSRDPGAEGVRRPDLRAVAMDDGATVGSW